MFFKLESSLPTAEFCITSAKAEVKSLFYEIECPDHKTVCPFIAAGESRVDLL